MIKFIYQYDNDSPLVEVTLKSRDANLDELLVAFENFLKGSGYVFSGQLDFINEDGINA